MMAQPCRFVSTLLECLGLPLREAVKGACEAVKGPCGIIALTSNGRMAASTTADFMPIAVASDEKIEVHVVKRGEALEL